MAENSKEPWNNVVANPNSDSQQVGKRSGSSSKKKHSKQKAPLSTMVLTVLVVIMFMIIASAILVTFIWNNRNPSLNSIESPFASSSSVSSSSLSTTSSSTLTSSTASSASDSSSTSSSSSNTYTVQAGDYPSLIAQTVSQQLGKTVTWDNIVALNKTSPDGGLDPNNPGYYKDGSQLTAGQVLKIK